MIILGLSPVSNVLSDRLYPIELKHEDYALQPPCPPSFQVIKHPQIGRVWWQERLYNAIGERHHTKPALLVHPVQ
jgi:hypothetical protein